MTPPHRPAGAEAAAPDAATHLGLARPVSPPHSARAVKPRLLFRMGRLGPRRRWIFLPGLVLRRFAGVDADVPARCVRGARAAAASGFWGELPGAAFALGPSTSVAPRYRQIAPADFDAVRDRVARLLAAASAAPRAPLARFVAGLPGLGLLDPRARAAALGRIGAATAPATGMHGDFHFFNFCKTRRGDLRLIDWEDYAPDGSFALDLVEFEMATRCFDGGGDWPDILARAAGADDAVVRRVAHAAGLRPDALWLAYLLHKVGRLAQRAGGWAEAPARDRALLHAALDAAIAAPGAARRRDRGAPHR